MKCVLYTAPGEFRYSNSDKPIPVPRNGEVLIKVECAALNPSDIYFL